MKKLRDEGFEKLKKAIKYTEKEQLDTPSESSSSTSLSSTNSKRFKKNVLEIYKRRPKPSIKKTADQVVMEKYDKRSYQINLDAKPRNYTIVSKPKLPRLEQS